MKNHVRVFRSFSVITLLGLTFLLGMSNRATEASEAGLVSYWPEDGSLNDAVGGNNPVGSSDVTFVPGKVGSGISLAPYGYVEIPDSPSLRNQQFTLSAWVRPDGPGPNVDDFGSIVILKALDFPAGTVEVSTMIIWNSIDKHFSFSIGDRSLHAVISANAFPEGSFYYVAATYDGTTVRLFVNGQLEGDAMLVKTIVYDSNPWTIGSTALNARSAGYPRTFNGVIDEVKIYNRALSASEVSNIYNPPAYTIKALFDQERAAKSGSAIPIKIQLLDVGGANVSAPTLAVHAVGVAQTSSSASVALNDSGSANPDFDFRYDSTLQGYIFNLKATGYATGTFVLNFTVSGESREYSVQFQVRQ